MAFDITTGARRSSVLSPYAVESPPSVAFWGPPGTGKTTTLMDVIEREIESGVPVSKIGGFTYRRSMAEEFADRAAAVSGEAVDDSSWFRTTHSAAYRLLDLNEEDVCDSSSLELFYDEYGYGNSGAVVDVDWDDDSPFAPASVGSGDSPLDGEGEAFLRAHSWCVNLGVDPIEAFDHIPLSGDDKRFVTRGEHLATFSREYEQFKREEGLLDFDDMLLMVLERNLAPPVDVLIEDEFQDKTPLQVAVYNVWARRAERVYVAGDPYQAINQYQGTDPVFMQHAFEMADESRVLDKSYRLGADTVDYAEKVLSSVDWELPEIEATGESHVETIPWSEYPSVVREHAEDESFHLVRANYLSRNAAGVLSEAGVPFTEMNDRGGRWTPRMVDLYNGVARVTRAFDENTGFGQPEVSLSRPELLEVLSALPASALSVGKNEVEDAVDDGLGLFEAASIRAIADVFVGNPFGRIEKRSGSSLVPTAVGSESVQERLARSFARRGGEPIESVDHTIGTIHGSKGQEADVVFLFNASTRTIQLESPKDEEMLVWYVGATRASKRLYIVTDVPSSKHTEPYLPYP
jgi:superfamily I DNA/RNA helicase